MLLISKRIFRLVITAVYIRVRFFKVDRYFTSGFVRGIPKISVADALASILSFA